MTEAVLMLQMLYVVRKPHKQHKQPSLATTPHILCENEPYLSEELHVNLF